MFSYTISRIANNRGFVWACRMIEDNFSDITKEKVLIDADGSMIQIYRLNGKLIKVYNDYEVDAVYVDSEIEIEGVFELRIPKDVLDNKHKVDIEIDWLPPLKNEK